jgi:hypothetical protein
MNIQFHLYIYGCLLSLVSCTFVFLSYWLFTSSSPWRRSSFLMWALRLVVVNGLLSFTALLWSLLSFRSGNDEVACRVFLPFPIFFFLCGYGCNIFIALRFTRDPGTFKSQILSKSPFYAVWAFCLTMVLPIIAMNVFNEYEISEVMDFDTPLSSKGSICMFSAHKLRAKVINNICFQIPLLLTLAINVWAYLKGLHALRDAPQSVC